MASLAELGDAAQLRTAPGHQIPYLSPYKPSNLHIAHEWGGGLETWVKEFSAADPYSHNLVLRARGTGAAYGLRLELADGKSSAVLEGWTLESPIYETAITHAEYTTILKDVMRRYRIRHVYVSTFIGQSLDLLDTSVPTTIVYHDYYPYCVGLNLHFDGVCTSCEPDRLTACLVRNPLSRLFRHNTAEYRVRLRQGYFERLARDALWHVCPTESVESHLKRVDPRFAKIGFVCVPHGAEVAGANCFGGAEKGRRLRLLVLGRLNVWKGLELLRCILPRLLVLGDLYLVGAGAEGREFAERYGVTLVEDFSRETLTPILERIRPDLALFMSVVPETFSYAMTEVWAHRIPVCARPVGSFRERVRPEDNGFWLPEAPERAIDSLLELDEDRVRLRRVHERLMSYQERSAGSMVDDYYALRGDYLRLAGEILGV